MVCGWGHFTKHQETSSKHTKPILGEAFFGVAAALALYRPISNLGYQDALLVKADLPMGELPAQRPECKYLSELPQGIRVMLFGTSVMS